uniref:Symplectin/biotinidase-like protein 3 n=1 Tax=Octopoteuthis deletron TaxID=1582096 RepID=A0A2Z5EQ40_9MOLL|nr:symplectin/biotinidase-like protein 3 [Octopoteuthis deletron]
MAFVPKGPFTPLVILVTAILVSYYIDGSNGSRYTASVFEFRPDSPQQGRNLSRNQALEIMKKNIDIYKVQAKIAGQQRHDIIVFPEYGLFGIFGYAKYARRSEVYPFLETIPDPRKESWNPCFDRSSNGSEIQKELSCMAKDYDVYVVANVGEKLACKKSDRNCPKDGRYQYNTNVVYSTNGTLVAKYRKKHLFKEEYFDSPTKTEIVTFDTYFGRFGLMTSYDSLFQSPIIDLVYRRKVRDIVMPSAWMTSTPLFRSIQWHSSFARGMEINLLVATVHDGHCKSYGSGIYTPDGAKNYFSNPTDYEQTLISDKLKLLSYFDPRNKSPVIPRGSISQTKTKKQPMAFLDENVDFEFIELSKTMDDVNVCYGRFCCRLTYRVEGRGRIEKYALAVYKGPVRTLGYLLEVEVCAVVRCSPHCGQPIQRANTYFERFHLVGVNFSTPYIYPQVLTVSGHETVLATHQWEYKHGQIIFTRSLENPLHSASLIGRVYDKDIIDDRKTYPGTYDKYGNYAPAQYASCFILIVACIASIIFPS